MLRATLLGWAITLPVLFASAVAGQLDFGDQNVVSESAQIPLGDKGYQLVCASISRSISPASQVFYPGTVFPLLSVLSRTAYYVDS